ncbi:MAG TPA: hypothetical protein VGX76_16030 [Pirellulales bacterium]|jgi:hypothetical protein|nr:hypothetical protein [Pirellulales bacterium]
MRFRALQPGACCLLTVVLAANNGLPLALEHAHPVGRNLQHDFKPDFANPTNGGRMVARPAIERGTPGDRGRECMASVFAVTAHVHLVWLGFEFTLLPPAVPTDDQDDSPPPASVSLARLVDNCLWLEVGRASPPRAIAVDPLTRPALAEAGAPIHPAGPAARNVAALPLCDAARHERSGVQLI